MGTVSAQTPAVSFLLAHQSKDSRSVVPAFAAPDMHSLSQVPKDRHRRLSGCSLPVLKQFGAILGSSISVAQSATQQDKLTDNASLSSTVPSGSTVRMADRILLGAKRKSQITQHRRLRFLHFLCTLCAEYAFQCYEIVPRPPRHSENLHDNGLIAGSPEALSVPGDLSKIGDRDFLIAPILWN
jgi:hypothetical protein